MGMKKKRLIDDQVVDLHEERISVTEIIDEIVQVKQREGNDDRFLMCDIGDVIEKVQRWRNLMPRIKIFYAVKCNTDQALLKILADMGVSFDCASKREIEAVLSLDVSPSRIVYAHPYKPVSSLNYAKLKDVSLMTFDTSIELYKIKDVYPSAKLLLRLLPEMEFDARIQFGSRFGCPLSEVKKVLRLAYDMNLSIVGVSFHVGSDVKDPEAYISVLSQSRDVFDIAEEIGFNMTILDIGGGFPGDHNTSRQFTKFAEVINKAVLELFPPDNNLEIIAEPGRYIVASAFTVVANIIGKRCYKKSIAVNETDDNDEIQKASNAKVSTTYFINDSVFGNFVFGHLYKPGSAIYTPKLVKAIKGKELVESTILGFTLAPGDCLNRSVMLPDLRIGDWIYYENMGAYTLSLTSSFNGLGVPDIKYHCLEDLWYQVYPKDREESPKNQ